MPAMFKSSGLVLHEHGPLLRCPMIKIARML